MSKHKHGWKVEVDTLKLGPGSPINEFVNWYNIEEQCWSYDPFYLRCINKHFVNGHKIDFRIMTYHSNVWAIHAIIVMEVMRVQKKDDNQIKFSNEITLTMVHLKILIVQG